MRTAIIYTDGSCKKNGRGGWGVFYEDDEQIIEISGGDPSTTNNRMELQAVIEAIRLKTDTTHRIVYTDSRYVQKGITQWISKWKKNSWKTSQNQPVLNRDLWEDLESIMDDNIDIRWVRGHDGCTGNERADFLANEGVRQLDQ